MIKVKVFLSTLMILFCFSDQLISQDARQWAARFSGMQKKGENSATAIAVDASGNVYVTGWVTRAVSGIDIVTIKYSPIGEKLAPDAYFTSTGKGTDKGLAIDIDTGKNVYVTGMTYVDGAGYNYITIKYDSSLSQVWASPIQYNGPGNADDVPVAIDVTDSLHVIVTGYSQGAGSGYDYATIKYAPDGNVVWEKRYNGPANGTDSALAMSMRGTADLFITGTSVDSGYDYYTIKYNAETGDSVWSARYNGNGFGQDIPRAIIARSGTEVYVTGASQNSGGNFDYLTIRYDAETDGGAAWISRYDGSANGDDIATAIALHSNKRVYVTGKSLQIGNFNDVLTIRYSQGDGELAWASAYNGTANDDDGGVALIGGGDPYVLAYSAGFGIGKDICHIVYDGDNGDLKQDVRYNGPYHVDDVPNAFLSSGGSLYIAGTSRKLKGSDMVTMQYVDRDQLKFRTLLQEDIAVKGMSIKSTSPPNGGNVRDEAFARVFPKIKKGYAGYPGGMFVGNPRYDSAKAYGWMRFDKGKNILKYIPASGPSRGFDLYGGKPFVGEKKNAKRENHDNHIAGELITLKINIAASDAEVTPPTLGDLIYDDGDTSNHFNGLTLRQMAMVVDNYLTYGTKYPVVNWALFDTIISRANSAFSRPTLGIVNISPVVVTGVEIVDSVWYLKPAKSLMANPITITPDAIDFAPDHFMLHQNYPNPFNPTTTIAFDLPEAGIVTLTIYDLLGREVATLLDKEPVEEGYQEYDFDAGSLASGVYIYRVIVNEGQYRQTMKMILMK